MNRRQFLASGLASLVKIIAPNLSLAQEGYREISSAIDIGALINRGEIMYMEGVTSKIPNSVPDYRNWRRDYNGVFGGYSNKRYHQFQYTSDTGIIYYENFDADTGLLRTLVANVIYWNGSGILKTSDEILNP